MEQALRDGDARARTKAKELETVLEAVPIPVLIAHDAKCTLITANRAGCELFKTPQGANISKSASAGERPKFRIMTDGVEVPTEQLPMQRSAATGKPVFGVQELIIFEDGTERNFIVNAAPLLGEDGASYGAVAAVLDITERKRAESAVRESEQRFRLVANTAPVLIWMSGPDKLFDYFNQPWLEFTGRPLDAELGNGWAQGVHPDDLTRCVDIYNQAFDRREQLKMEYRLRRHDGEYRWVLTIGVPRFNADRSFAGYIGSGVDITERKQAEETLSSVSRRLIEAHEEERSWLARELHDDINQRIALLAVELGNLEQTPRASAAGLHRRLNEIRNRISDLGRDVQALSHHLHSSKLEYLGLAAAASGFCKEVSQQQNVEIDFVAEGIPRTASREISLCLFRVLQEALQNAVKHSGVKHITVELHGDSNEIRMAVIDLGVGFNPEAAKDGTGLGLISMRERLHLVKGELSIESAPNRGTTFRARVPLASGEHVLKAAG